MLFLLFQVGAERCALDAQRVVEVVPLVTMKRLPQAPPGVAGMFLYRGRPVPAIDLCQLGLGRPAADHFSTRIIIVNHSNPAGEEQLLGLIAERVTETLQRNEREIATPNNHTQGDNLTGPVLIDAQGVIQLLVPEKLMENTLRNQLFPQPVEARNEED